MRIFNGSSLQACQTHRNCPSAVDLTTVGSPQSLRALFYRWNRSRHHLILQVRVAVARYERATLLHVFAPSKQSRLSFRYQIQLDQLYPSDQRIGLNRRRDLSGDIDSSIAGPKLNDSVCSGDGGGMGNLTIQREDFSSGCIVTGAVIASRHSEERGDWGGVSGAVWWRALR